MRGKKEKSRNANARPCVPQTTPLTARKNLMIISNNNATNTPRHEAAAQPSRQNKTKPFEL